MTAITLKAHPGVGDTVTGTALVAADNFSARYDLNLRQGVFSRPDHKLFGQSYVGKILVVNAAKGGVATAWMLHSMMKSGKAPAALLLNFANPILAQGAVFADLTFMDRFETDITQAVKTGDQVAVYPSDGRIEVRPA